ncbi:hypothetical protein L226DRAFT_390959 [Lentinus tigrinus ALCF2SS1-7]|uniref:uncharacterized protein n=1 Tax=Lentinus tigrinus ALCF2SS1-7 TaxID=1328758 RepID=UPI001165CBBA|nr:hypothetical protein L226DRAFT_390959 [Lentinus tigrinus ALCF2SS1-7]
MTTRTLPATGTLMPAHAHALPSANLLSSTTLTSIVSVGAVDRGEASGDSEEPVKAFARWAGYVGRQENTDATPTAKKIHVSSASIPPERTLRRGMRVRVMATTPAWYSAPDADPDAYEAYDAHVVGIITRVVGGKGERSSWRSETNVRLTPWH